MHFKDNLDKDIIPSESKVIVKKNSIKICMRKAKGQYGYDSWMDITAKKTRNEDAAQGADPSSGIMDLMKQMYDDGDDTLKKTIGEAMMKSRNGEPDKFDDKPSSRGALEDLDFGHGPGL